MYPPPPSLQEFYQPPCHLPCLCDPLPATTPTLPVLGCREDCPQGPSPSWPPCAFRLMPASLGGRRITLACLPCSFPLLLEIPTPFLPPAPAHTPLPCHSLPLPFMPPVVSLYLPCSTTLPTLWLLHSSLYAFPLQCIYSCSFGEHTYLLPSGEEDAGTPAQTCLPCSLPYIPLAALPLPPPLPHTPSPSSPTCRRMPV